jgi:hypothetical protein
LVLAKPSEKVPEHVSISSQGVPETQLFEREQQKPGSGVLDVQCLHVGPSLVLRITDHSDPRSIRSEKQKSSSPSEKRTEEGLATKSSRSLDLQVQMPAGIGISLIGSQCEELVYALFSGVELNLLKQGNNYQLNGHVNVVQVESNNSFCLT